MPPNLNLYLEWSPDIVEGEPYCKNSIINVDVFYKPIIKTAFRGGDKWDKF